MELEDLEYLVDPKPHPKPKRMKLNTKEYKELRIKLYNDTKEHCPRCQRWRSFDQMHIHHVREKCAGKNDDNVEFLCYQCHRDTHDANT
jgi:hypothetical protein